MKDSERYKQFEADAEVLRNISARYDEGSAEFQALRQAALALAYVTMNKQDEFAAFVEDMNSDLSEEQRNELRERYGIDDPS